MKYEIKQIHERVECCLVYIDDVDAELKELIRNNFLEIVMGKRFAEREEDEEHSDSLKDAAKYIYQKSGDTNRAGIIGELIFHSVLRTENLSKKYLSACPTIGYSDCYQGFFKGFDGCYYYDNSVWIVEVKSKLKSSQLDDDNKSKSKEASQQIAAEAKDEKINRWEKAKKHVYMQLDEIEQNETKIFELLKKPNRQKYNLMLGTLLICENGNFNKEFIKKFLDELFHTDVADQKLLMVCIRSFDYEKIIEFVEREIGENVAV